MGTPLVAAVGCKVDSGETPSVVAVELSAVAAAGSPEVDKQQVAVGK